MLLLDHLIAADEQHAVTSVRADAQSWYADTPKTMPAWIGIELMAQTIAVHVGWNKAQQGLPPKQGVLLGTRAYRCDEAVFQGALEVEATLSFMDESGLGAYDCCIRMDGRSVATATVKVFEPEDFQQFFNSQSNS
ncbi:MAG: beta-hydroxyacyl-ACP dehydratase [Rhodocyclaceae bacterium]|nr:MAG: beta-hydroxyacyl-ACP dehydratase [Rhodocyclaceae bacterium]